MRNKLLTILLMFACLLPLSAGNPPEPLYKTHSEFTIKAYKNDPGGNNPATILSVYDALTGTLNEVGNSDTTRMAGEIDVFDYLDRFLTTDTTSIKYPKNNVLFSFLVSGSGHGSYTLELTVNKFEGPYKVESNGDLGSVIVGKTYPVDAYFQLWKVDVIFPSVHAKTAGKHTISMGSDSNTVGSLKEAPRKAPYTYSLTWQVLPTKGKLTASWIAEGIILMAIDKSQYDKAPTGGYKSTVTVKLTTN